MISFILILAVALPINQTLIGNCSSTMYGCCEDNTTYCVNANCSNCHKNQTLIGNCSSTMYGCCEDNTTYCVNANCSNCHKNQTVANM